MEVASILKHLYAGVMSANRSPPRPHRHDDLVIQRKERKTVVTLLPDDCRWPIGDPQVAGFHFCGKQKVEGRPYCECHMRRGFQPARPFREPHRPRVTA